MKEMFNSEVELSKFLGSIDVIPDAFKAISDTKLAYELHTSPSGIKILAFKSLPHDYTTRFLNGEFELVSSENHKQVVDFISTKVNSSFSINKAAVELFEQMSDDLKELEKQHINTPPVITGSGLGGYLAILYTLGLHQAVDVEESNYFKKNKRPFCITFGTPLVGDVALQRAILDRPTWECSFLSVVSKKDPVASFFTSKTPYKPIGTSLFCTESGGHSAFKDQEEVLAVLDTIASSNAGNKQVYDYGNVLSLIRKKRLYRGVTKSGDSNFPLKAGIIWQLKEVELLEDISNDWINKMEKTRTKMTKPKNVNLHSRLNDMKVSLIYMEWFMKTKKAKRGYYDSYKNPQNRDDMARNSEIRKHVNLLNQYWRISVDQYMKQMLQEDPDVRRHWLYSGTTFRRMIEPLEIAKYYGSGKTNYMENRPDHFRLLEKWLVDDQKDRRSLRYARKESASLTKDSCFWAHVEEAVISLKDLETSASLGEESVKPQGLQVFEANVRSALKVSRSRWMDS